MVDSLWTMVFEKLNCQITHGLSTMDYGLIHMKIIFMGTPEFAVASLDALVKAGFYAQWQKTYGEAAWAELEKFTGKLT